MVGLQGAAHHNCAFLRDNTGQETLCNFQKQCRARAVEGILVRTAQFLRADHSKPVGGLTQHDYAVSVGSWACLCNSGEKCSPRSQCSAYFW